MRANAHRPLPAPVWAFIVCVAIPTLVACIALVLFAPIILVPLILFALFWFLFSGDKNDFDPYKD